MNLEVLKCENLNKKIGKKEIIKGISFDMQQGEILGFIGPNGAGKTTTIKLILGLQQITKVKILKYFITPNWDLSIYLFGGKGLTEGLNFEISLCISIVYILCTLLISLLVFNKRDIKNI